jgi:ribosomal protein S27E
MNVPSTSPPKEASRASLVYTGKKKVRYFLNTLHTSIAGYFIEMFDVKCLCCWNVQILFSIFVILVKVKQNILKNKFCSSSGTIDMIKVSFFGLNFMKIKVKFFLGLIKHHAMNMKAEA